MESSETVQQDGAWLFARILKDEWTTTTTSRSVAINKVTRKFWRITGPNFRKRYARKREASSAWLALTDQRKKEGGL